MSRSKLFRAALAATLLFPLAPVAAQQEESARPIRLNQLGLQPNGPKRAMLAHPSAAPLRWKLTDTKGATVSRGTTRVFGKDAASGEHVHEIDFSSFNGRGNAFRLEAGGLASRAFLIDPAIYRQLPYDALNYFYQNRAGTPIEARFAGGQQWARPAGHPAETVQCISGTDGSGNRWPGCDYTLDVTGGWYDAGDHGKYVVNGGISLWTLLNLYERQALQGAAAFADGKAAVPERGNGVNDLLDEARWEMEFLLAMQVPEGRQATVPVAIKRSAPNLRFTRIDASGMAHHKVADEKWTSLPMAPHKDPERRVLFPPSTGATLNLAATAAQCARIWRTIDPALSGRCLAAAERAYAAALRNPEVYAIADFTGSGGYGDRELSDEFYWAAAELFITTGKPPYEKAVRASPHFAVPAAADFGWPTVGTLGTMSLALLPSRLPQRDVHRLRKSIAAAADAYLRQSESVGYRIPYAPAAGYPWGSNSSILNRAMTLALAHDFTGQRRYRDGVVDAMDYVLGRNPLDRSYVSGYGARPMRNPHHRFWALQADASFPPPPPGALSGGPNSTSMSDDAAGPLKGKCAPQTCWLDDYRAFSLNEVAINWNAPLVWVAAWLDEAR